MSERKTQYKAGWDDAIDGAMLLLTMGIDFYPNLPSEQTIAMIMPVGDGQKLLGLLGAFHESVVKQVEQRLKEAANGAATT